MDHREIHPIRNAFTIIAYTGSLYCLLLTEEVEEVRIIMTIMIMDLMELIRTALSPLSDKTSTAQHELDKPLRIPRIFSLSVDRADHIIRASYFLLLHIKVTDVGGDCKSYC